jgi:hypothetical protein
MKSYKQSSLLLRNAKELDLCFMIIDTQNESKDIYYFYKANDKSEQFKVLKGTILAITGISNGIFYAEPHIITFSFDKKLYKCTSGYNFNQYIFAVIVPFYSPDNITVFIYKEFIKFCNMFFGKFSESANFLNILDKVCEFLFYMCVKYLIRNNNLDIVGTPISIIPIINTTFTYNEVNPSFLIKTSLSDSLRYSIIEQMNTLNNDKSIFQETLTLMEPPYYLIGYALLFRGFVLYNTLSNQELLNPIRLSIIHQIYLRTQSSPEVLVCEFIFDEAKNKMLTTILGQREFVMIISLEILNKNNCTFDPFYHLRAQDLLVNLLKKNFSSIISEELYKYSIKLENSDFMTGINLNSEQNNYEESEIKLNKVKKRNMKNEKINEVLESIMSFNKDIEYNDTNPINNKNLYQSNLTVGNNNLKGETKINNLENKNKNDKSKNRVKIDKSEINLSEINIKIKGYIDGQTNINIIHFSCYDDSENIINTTDLNISKKLYEEIYNYIFVTYAKIQSNINKLKKRNQKYKTSKIFSFNENNESLQIERKDLLTKSKENRKNFIKSINNNSSVYKLNKITEFGTNFNNNLNEPIWICCKLYENISIEDDLNMDTYSNYKVIFVSYESMVPVDIDSFCQDLIMNELFL